MLHQDSVGFLDHVLTQGYIEHHDRFDEIMHSLRVLDNLMSTSDHRLRCPWSPQRHYILQLFLVLRILLFDRFNVRVTTPSFEHFLTQPCRDTPWPSHFLDGVTAKDNINE